MQATYGNYTREIVNNDLAGYVPVAYVHQESNLPTRLLAAVCSYYTEVTTTWDGHKVFDPLE
jgi:hypothetical protein